LIGASKVSQVEEIVAGLENLTFSEDELRQIEMILAG
jgi:L-glyceraldehyde 3-phosphate reductase